MRTHPFRSLPGGALCVASVGPRDAYEPCALPQRHDVHAVGDRSPRDVTITLSDGRTLQGRVTGFHREAVDLGQDEDGWKLFEPSSVTTLTIDVATAELSARS
jgi:hypothetical protein